MDSLCRDCTTPVPGDAKICPDCGGGRLARHPDLFTLHLAHIDCDAFFAAIEKRDNPALKDKPVLVGGGQRGVVSTCCYIARLYGVRSAMPMFKALKACPDAVVVHPNFEKYSAAAAIIRAKMYALTPLVEVVSVDEAYLDLSGTQKVNKASPAQALARLALEVEKDVGITLSIGLSVNKFLAKTASELDKPRGFAAINAEQAPALLAQNAPGFLHGVGPKLAAKLARDGFSTIGKLQQAPQKDLTGRYGETGLWLYERAWGRDTRRVESDRERKSISAETTFNTDISDLGQLENALWTLCVKTADRAKALGTEGNVVTLKLKTQTFQALTRRTSMPAATQLAQSLFRTTRPMLAREANGRKFRLIGIGLSSLQDAAKQDAIDLLDPSIQKRAGAERAADIARARFGKDAVRTGRAVRLDKS